MFQRRIQEADEFYATRVDLPKTLADARMSCARLRRNALEQAVLPLRRRQWLNGDPTAPTAPRAAHGRNHDWTHLYNADVISMPDKWEYPWYAAWDLAFHCVPLALVDPDFAKDSSC